VVDPIDGTVNYLYGSPWYAVSVAVTRDGVALAGAVVEPASGRVWSASAGGGASLDGRPLRASTADRLDMALIGTGFNYHRGRRIRQGALAAELLSRVRDIRRAGAASLDLCAVAAGWLDGYYEHGVSPWDWAAGALVASEAGATVYTPDPAAPFGDAIVAAASGIQAQLTEALAELGAARV
jgi:myo-inositol-1(or 4)-monophosphatase